MQAAEWYVRLRRLNLQTSIGYATSENIFNGNSLVAVIERAQGAILFIAKTRTYAF